MSIGAIHANVKLDKTNHVYCGSTEPIIGNVILGFRADLKGHQQGVQEFFGPLEVRVTLHGRLKTKIKKSNGNSTSIYRGRMPIFSTTRLIFKDSARINTRETWPVPFEFHFPGRFGNAIGNLHEKDQYDRFDISQDQELPPSFSESYHGYRNNFHSFVEYRIGVQIYVPTLPVRIVTPDKEQETLVHYERPRSLQAAEPQQFRRKGIVRISNEFLLPEADRPSGFRQKAKAKLSSDYYPQYNFDWLVVAPQEIHIGQPIPFEISIKPREGNTATVIPDVFLKSFRASLIGCTVVRAEKQIFTTPEAEHEEPCITLQGVPDDPGPFNSSSEWKKTLNTISLSAQYVSSSFRSVIIMRQYRLKLTFNFAAAREAFNQESQFSITVLPPLAEPGTAAAAASAAAAAAGSSATASGSAVVDEPLPLYEEGLPAYDEAVEGEAPVPPSKNSGLDLVDERLR